MASYNTIHQHAPLRSPQKWGAEERMLINQLEEILDDVYARFNRIKTTDLNKDLRESIETVISSTEIIGQNKTAIGVLQQRCTDLENDTTADAVVGKVNAGIESGDVSADALFDAVNGADGVFDVGHIALEGYTSANGKFKLGASGSAEIKDARLPGVSLVKGAVTAATSTDLIEETSEMADMGETIDALAPVVFNYASETREHYGLIYEDAVEVAPTVCYEETQGVSYAELVPVLIKEIQSLRSRVAALEGSE